jgi:hypothetical protein
MSGRPLVIIALAAILPLATASDAEAGAALLTVALATPALACPPSLTVERPAASSARDANDAFVLVHANHGCHAGQLVVAGTAEGLVRGERRSIRLDLVRTPTAGVYAVRKQWPAEGVWVLDLSVSEGDGHMTALVGIGPSGEVTQVRGPAVEGRALGPASGADVDAFLRELAAG